MRTKAIVLGAVLGCSTTDPSAAQTTDPAASSSSSGGTGESSSAGASSLDPAGSSGPTSAADTTTAPSSTDDGDPPAGFDPDDGFDVEGDFVHGGVVTIRRAGGGFGTRARVEPWLFDRVAQQWLAGEAQDAYLGLVDGDPIDTSIWTDQGYYVGWDGPEHKLKYTTDPSRLRHARVDAQYGNYAASPADPKPYSKLAFPAWPAAWGAQTNAQLYLSWWQRMDGATPGYPQDGDGNGGEDKPLRFGDTAHAGLGEFDITVAGLTATTVGFGNVKSWGSFPDPGAAWHRIEIFIDREVGIADMWVDGALSIGSSWTVRPDDGGDFEFRPADDYLWVTPASTGAELDTASWQNVTVHFLGFDDGGTTQQFAPGRNVELSEIYVDTSRARVEIADVEAWEERPDAARTAELCGRLLAWNDDTITVELEQGAFAELAGRWLWVVDDAGVPIRVGRFT